MVKEKKNFDPFKGNKINQSFKSPFIDEFNEWRENCQGISGGALKTKNVPKEHKYEKLEKYTTIKYNKISVDEDDDENEKIDEILDAYLADQHAFMQMEEEEYGE